MKGAAVFLRLLIYALCLEPRSRSCKRHLCGMELAYAALLKNCLACGGGFLLGADRVDFLGALCIIYKHKHLAVLNFDKSR